MGKTACNGCLLFHLGELFFSSCSIDNIVCTYYYTCSRKSRSNAYTSSLKKMVRTWELQGESLACSLSGTGDFTLAMMKHPSTLLAARTKHLWNSFEGSPRGLSLSNKGAQQGFDTTGLTIRNLEDGTLQAPRRIQVASVHSSPRLRRRAAVVWPLYILSKKSQAILRMVFLLWRCF